MTDHLDEVQTQEVVRAMASQEYTTTWNGEGPLNFAEFGLDRKLLPWVPCNWGFPVLDLGPGNKVVPGAVRLDWPEYDWEPVRFSRLVTVPRENRSSISRTVQEGELSTYGKLPYDDNHVGGIFCVNLLEHLWDPRPLIWEMARVLRPGCPINVFVPHADSIMYKQDLDHKKPFVLDTWRNLLDPHPYYDKGHAPKHGLVRGCEFKLAVKEGNEACIAQLIKTETTN
jgi:SAM-dependent methyltransferase